MQLLSKSTVAVILAVFTLLVFLVGGYVGYTIKPDCEQSRDASTAVAPSVAPTL